MTNKEIKSTSYSEIIADSNSMVETIFNNIANSKRPVMQSLGPNLTSAVSVLGVVTDTCKYIVKNGLELTKDMESILEFFQAFQKAASYLLVHQPNDIGNDHRFSLDECDDVGQFCRVVDEYFNSIYNLDTMIKTRDNYNEVYSPYPTIQLMRTGIYKVSKGFDNSSWDLVRERMFREGIMYGWDLSCYDSHTRMGKANYYLWAVPYIKRSSMYNSLIKVLGAKYTERPIIVTGQEDTDCYEVFGRDIKVEKTYRRAGFKYNVGSDGEGNLYVFEVGTFQ